MESFHIRKDGSPSHLPRAKPPPINQFRFQARKVAFDHCVVPTSPRPGHRTPDAMHGELSLIGQGHILTAAIRVMQQAARDPPLMPLPNTVPSPPV